MKLIFIFLSQVLHERDHGHVEPETSSEAREEQQPSAARPPAKEEDRAPSPADDVFLGNRPRFSLRIRRDACATVITFSRQCMLFQLHLTPEIEVFGFCLLF